MSTITTKDGTQIYYKDLGAGPVITFSHGWPLNSDAWDGQMMFLVQQGYRCIAHDRRGHGRSSQASAHNDMNGRRSEEHTSELQSRQYLVCRLLLEKKKKKHKKTGTKNKT